MEDPSSLTRYRTCAPCSGSSESSPLDRQGSPRKGFLKGSLELEQEGQVGVGQSRKDTPPGRGMNQGVECEMHQLPGTKTEVSV